MPAGGEASDVGDVAEQPGRAGWSDAVQLLQGAADGGDQDMRNKTLEFASSRIEHRLKIVGVGWQSGHLPDRTYDAYLDTPVA